MAKQEKVVQQKMQAFKMSQDLALEVFDQKHAESTASSDSGSDANNTAEEQKNVETERKALVDDQIQAYYMMETSLKQQVLKKLSKQQKTCETSIAKARTAKIEQIERGAHGVLIKSGVHRESFRVDAGSLVVHGEEGADTVICPVGTEPAVQVEGTKPKPLRRFHREGKTPM